jgi:hypothetical protein
MLLVDICLRNLAPGATALTYHHDDQPLPTRVQAVETLLDLKVKHDMRNSEGQTALDLAFAFKGKDKAIQHALLACPASPKKAKPSKGKEEP